MAVTPLSPSYLFATLSTNFSFNSPDDTYEITSKNITLLSLLERNYFNSQKKLSGDNVHTYEIQKKNTKKKVSVDFFFYKYKNFEIIF